MKRIYVWLSFSLLAPGMQGQRLSPNQSRFLQKNTHSICAEESIANADWRILAQQVKNKRIILIGEFNHGSKEIFQLRNDLIRYLHKEQGFKIILFESGMGELALPDLRKGEMNPAQMTYGLFGGWRTKEFRDLMEYIKSENISIAGFDVQRTGGSFKRLLNEAATKKSIDTVFYSDLEDRYGLIQRELTNRRAVYDSVQPKTYKLITDYRAVYNKLFESNTTNSSKELMLSLRTIINRVDFLQYMLQFVKDQDWNKRWAARDSAMAENIQWLLDNIYKNEKIIVIAHNFHIAKFNENERVMGAILSRMHAKEMYSIGIFAGAGVYADNSGKEEKITPADSINLDIKHIINSVSGFVSYLDMPEQGLKGSEWLYENIVVNDTFIDLKGSNKMVLARQFDGLLFIKKVSLPEK